MAWKWEKRATLHQTRRFKSSIDFYRNCVIVYRVHRRGVVTDPVSGMDRPGLSVSLFTPTLESSYKYVDDYDYFCFQ